MLAATVKDVSQLKFPLLATPKIDGIRALKVNGKLVSRTFKPIPNNHIRTTLESILPDGIDGEIVVGKTFQECSSGVMSVHGKPKFVYYAFDLWVNSAFNYYVDRLNRLNSWFEDTCQRYDRVRLIDGSMLVNLQGAKVWNVEGLLAYEHQVLVDGYEGVMLRSPTSPYKCGRSTLKEQYLLKLKRFTDSEAVVIGVVEAEENLNPQEADAFGNAKRSSHQANKHGKGMMGALIVRDLKTGVEFNIGTGFTEEDRKEFWSNRIMLGKVVKYKYFSVGVKDKPRHPVFLGFRDKEDM